MEVTINAIVEVLNGVEKNVKEAVSEQKHCSAVSLDRLHHLKVALKDVQAAITELLQVGYY